MKAKAVNIVLFFGIIALLFSIISVFTAVPSTEISVEGGSADLTDTNLTREVAAVRPERFDYYPGVYVSPGSFGDAPVPRYFTEADKSDYQYGTFRVMLRLPAGKTYAFRAKRPQTPFLLPAKRSMCLLPKAIPRRLSCSMPTSSTGAVENPIRFMYQPMQISRGWNSFPCSAPVSL